MRYENEIDILEDISHYENKEICLVTQSALEEEILNSLRCYSEFYDNNSGHECLPPDFVSSNNSFMFDVMRINDSEKRKSNNPVMRREREIQREIQDAFQGTNLPQHALSNGLVINAMTEEDYDQAHNYPQYLKQFRRVVEQHISKIEGCRERHLGQRMGFLIFDETDIYMEYANAEDAKKPWIVGDKVMIRRLHVPFLDKNFMEVLEAKGVDFLIWALPYKVYSGGPYELPRLGIIDLTLFFSNKDSFFVKYAEECLRSR